MRRCRTTSERRASASTTQHLTSLLQLRGKEREDARADERRQLDFDKADVLRQRHVRQLAQLASLPFVHLSTLVLDDARSDARRQAGHGAVFAHQRCPTDEMKQDKN